MIEMKYTIFYLADKEKMIPLGMAVWDTERKFYYINWYFRDAERDVQSEYWQLAERLFFKVIDWQQELVLPKADGRYMPYEDQFWQHIDKHLLPKELHFTQPRCMDSLLNMLIVTEGK